MKIGFIGLGKMGVVMAQRLLDGGHELAVFNRTPAKASGLIEQGATSGSVGEVAGHGAIVVTMLEHDQALQQILDAGLIASLAKDAVHLCMGTHSLAMIEKAKQAHQAAGQLFVSAPVLGRPPAAAAGQLGIIAAGDGEGIERCRPLFEALGRRTYEAGSDASNAAAAKIVNNFLLAAAIEALGEGFALSKKCGVPPAVMLDVITDGLFSGPAHKIYGKIVAEDNYYGEPGFTATTGLKDVMLALTAGVEKSVPLPSANVCRDHLLSAIARGDGHLDWTVMALEQARASGLA